MPDPVRADDPPQRRWPPLRVARTVLCGALLITVVWLGGLLAERTVPDLWALAVPLPFAAVTVTLVFGVGVAYVILIPAMLVLHLAFGRVVGAQGAYLLLSAIGIVLATSGNRKRRDLLESALIVAGVLSIATLLFGFGADEGWSGRLKAVALGAFTIVASFGTASLTLPFFERLAGTTTDFTLREWGDPDHPLLRRLSLEAPGTFAHSMRLASLVETACQAIGANALLGRVGAYYHDIGKLSATGYFVENQAGANPHDSMTPESSAGVIRLHVEAGLALARKYRLPAEIRDFIAQHHGTVPIAFFLAKERTARGAEWDGAGGGAGASFYYPGPVPQRRETAICMLADGVEAAMRVLPGGSDGGIRDVVRRIVSLRREQGQLDRCGLSPLELERIQDEFVRALTGMAHSRIGYPESTGGISARDEVGA